MKTRQLNLQILWWTMGVLVLWSACPSAAQMETPTTVEVVAAEARQQQRGNITMPLAIYILKDDDSGDLSSDRTEEDVERIFRRINAEIWSQAGIVLELQTLRTIAVSSDILHALNRREWNRLWTAINRGNIDNLDRRTTPIWGFFVQTLGGNNNNIINGIQPTNTRSFFVADNPTVLDYRTTAHEIGHLLELYHTNEVTRLMASATNGMVLSEEEQVVARYVAGGMMAY